MFKKSMRLLLLITFLIPGGYSFSQSALPADVALRVVIIRHGEKPKKGDNLSCQGLNRALALPPVLYGKFGIPDFVYVPTMKTGKSTSSVRMFQTVTPFVVKYNLTVNSRHAETDTVAAAAAVMKKTGTVLMVWEHGNIPGLARNFGATNVPDWGHNDFDSIWIIDFIKQPSGNPLPTLTFSKEGLKPGVNCE